MSGTCSLFPPFGDPWPSCLLPSHYEGENQNFSCSCMFVSEIDFKNKQNTLTFIMNYQLSLTINRNYFMTSIQLFFKEKVLAWPSEFFPMFSADFSDERYGYEIYMNTWNLKQIVFQVINSSAVFFFFSPIVFMCFKTGHGILSNVSE